MIVKSKRESSSNLSLMRVGIDAARTGRFSTLLLIVILSFTSAVVSAQRTVGDSASIVDKSSSINDFPSVYKDRPVAESEFDHDSSAYVKDWRQATPIDQYEDTEFGELLYNEASTPTKLEMLRLLSKDTPSILVFMTALSMGLDIESVLQASVNYQPNKSRDLASSAVTVLPLICLLYTSPSPRDKRQSRMPSSA